MQEIYGLGEPEKRKLKFLYEHSGIESRHSVIGDFSLPAGERAFIPANKDESFPSLEQRMEIYNREAVVLSQRAIEDCIQGWIGASEITHLITVSCTGMSAPGLDLQL